MTEGVMTIIEAVGFAPPHPSKNKVPSRHKKGQRLPALNVLIAQAAPLLSELYACHWRLQYPPGIPDRQGYCEITR